MAETNQDKEKVIKSPEKNTLILQNPIDINGKSIKKLSYDFDSLTASDICRADKEAQKLSGNSMGNRMGEFDKEYHLFLFSAAVEKKNPEFDILEVLRLEGKDVIAAMRIGRVFFIESINGQDEQSDEQ